MPKYVVGCIDGHDKICSAPFEIFDEFKRTISVARCGTRLDGQSLVEAGTICMRPIYIKPQAAQFTIQAGLYDDFSTGSVQEKQLRREGYL